jgi:hypothetical protein
MSRTDKHRGDDQEIQKIIDLLELEGRQIDNAFEDVDKLVGKIECLANKIIGIRN